MTGLACGETIVDVESVWDRRERERIRERQRTLDDVRSRLQEAGARLRALGVEEAWLVGSFARGDPRSESDVDLLVRGLDRRSRAKAWWDLGRLFGREVDLGEIERMEASRLAAALRGGVRFIP